MSQSESDGLGNAVCANKDCESPTPADMPAIVLDEEWYCCPDCARVAIKAGADPGSVRLMDPKFQADRSVIDGFGPDDHFVERRVTDSDDALHAIETLEVLFAGEFRVTEPAGRTNLKLSKKTKQTLDDVKQPDETWDECLQRLAQLDRATRVD